LVFLTNVMLLKSWTNPHFDTDIQGHMYVRTYTDMTHTDKQSKVCILWLGFLKINYTELMKLSLISHV